MKIKIALAFVFLFLSVPAGAETYQECIERRNQQRIQAMALEAPYIEIKCVKPPEEPKIEWLGKIIYLEEGERRKIQTMPLADMEKMKEAYREVAIRQLPGDCISFETGKQVDKGEAIDREAQKILKQADGTGKTCDPGLGAKPIIGC